MILILVMAITTNQMRDTSGYVKLCPLVSDRADFSTVIWWWLGGIIKLRKTERQLCWHI